MNLLGKIIFGTRLLKAKLAKNRVPLLVQFSVTNNCNSQCIYCYAKYYERKHKNLPTSDIFTIINELVNIGTRRINLVGGEPLLRNDIEEIISYIKQRGLECALTSNGHLVPQRIDSLKQLDCLCLSLDGDRIAHDANRGKGSYDKVMKAIRAAKEAKIPIEVATVLTRSNLNCIDLILAMAKKWGFTVGFTTLINQPSDTGKIPAECIPSNEQYREAIRKIIHRKRQGAPILFSEKSFRFCLNWPDYRIDKFIGKEPNFNYPKCYAGKYYCIIDVNGDVYPCPQLVGEMKVLNCLEHGLKKAWDYIAFHECKTCHMPCSNDFNYLFSLDIPVIINMLRCYTR